MENQESVTDLNLDIQIAEPEKPSKFFETLFLGTMAGFGIMVGFSNGISLAKKNDEKSFTKGLMMLNEKPNMPQMESGVRFAMRALGLGSVYAFAGVGLVCSAIWWGVGANDLKEFRQKMGDKLPKVPKNEPQGRTEFESFRELFNYLAEEKSTAKKSVLNSDESSTTIINDCDTINNNYNDNDDNYGNLR